MHVSTGCPGSNIRVANPHHLEQTDLSKGSNPASFAAPPARRVGLGRQRVASAYRLILTPPQRRTRVFAIPLNDPAFWDRKIRIAILTLATFAALC
jgi:hypothetical protein